jgi:serine/threonine-protein kinase
MAIDPEKTNPASGPDPTDRSGQTLGDFALLRRLGEGGMGQVYLADQLSLKRRVAIKVLRGDLATNEVSRKRFKAEAEAVARLAHANIVQLHEFHDESSPHFMVLEFVDGRNLRDYLLRKGPPELPVALSIMWQVASALQRAAEFGIVHRDIKPENILLTKKNEVKVADFGLSRMLLAGQEAQHLTQTGVTMGTPLYMSPEQVEGKPTDHRTDLYSFGVTCYHLLSGQPPFEGENAFAVALQHVQKEPLPLEALRPDLPPELCGLVHRLLAKKPEERCQSAGEVLRHLKGISELVSGTKADPVVALSALNMPPSPSLTELTPVPVMSGTHSLPALPTSSGSWLVWPVLVAASLVLALSGGALTAWALRPPPEEPLPDSPEAANSASLETLLGSYRKKERAFNDLINETENPGKEREELRRGIQHRMDLGLLFLEQQPRELRRAEELFTVQSKSKIKEYEYIGRMGQAMVLAFKDEPEKSNRALLEALTLPRDNIPPNLRWLKMLLTALDHNKRNCLAQKLRYPPELQRFEDNLRRGPGLPPGAIPLPPAKTG